MVRHRYIGLIALTLGVALIAGCGGKAPSPGPSADQNPPAASQPEEQLVPAVETTDPFEAVQLKPVDESEKNAEFAAFYAEFKKAVEEKDVDALLSMVDPNIRTTFGEGGGIDDFRKMWKLNEDPEKSEVWGVLTDIVRQGGTFLDEEQKAFFAPYVFSTWPEALDAFTHVALTGEQVPVRVEPKLDAGVVEKADYQIAKLMEINPVGPAVEIEGQEYKWYKVGLPSGNVGYVTQRDAYSPVYWRAGFNNMDGQWKMTILVAGD